MDGDYSGRIIGYTNPGYFFPSPVVTIYQDKTSLIIRWPNLETIPLSAQKLRDLQQQPQYIEESQKRFISPEEFAYAFSPDRIILSNSKDIIGELEKELGNPNLTRKDRFIIEDFMAKL